MTVGVPVDDHQIDDLVLLEHVGVRLFAVDAGVVRVIAHRKL